MQINNFINKIIENKLIEFNKEELIINYYMDFKMLNRNFIYNKTVNFVIALINKIEEKIKENKLLEKFNFNGFYDEMIESLYFYDFETNELNLKQIIISIYNDVCYNYFLFPIKKEHTEQLVYFFREINLNYDKKIYRTLYELRKNYKSPTERGFNDITYLQTLLENSIQISKNLVEFDIEEYSKNYNILKFVLKFDKLK